MAKQLRGRCELNAVELAVFTAARHQLRMGTLLDDHAMDQHRDSISPAHGGEAMGDHQRGAVLHQMLERFLHLPFPFGVERRGRFVKNQNRRVLDQRASDRKALALAPDSRTPNSPITVS